MAKPSAPYPALHLPSLSGDVAAVDLGAAGEKLQFLSALPDIGFELMFDDVFVGIQSSLTAKREASRQRKRYGRVLAGRKPEKTQNWTQLWRHPAGALVVVDRFRHRETSPWMFNNIEMFSRQDMGYGSKSGDSSWRGMGSCMYGPSGEAMVLLGAREQFHCAWADLKNAAAAGRLVPIEKWEGLPAPLNRVLLAHQPLRAKLPPVEEAATPQQIHQMEASLLAASVPALANRRRRQLSSLDMSPLERQAWQRFLGQAALKLATNRGQVSLGDPPPLPRWIEQSIRSNHMGAPSSSSSNPKDIRASIRWNVISDAMRKTLQDAGLESDEDLTQNDRATVRQWLVLVADRRHPLHLQDDFKRATNTSLERLNVQFHHLLFAASSLPGVARQAAWWQSLQSSQDLRRMCMEVQSDGRTLPMRWMSAWMHTPNKRADPRATLHRQRICRQALDRLAQVASPSLWTIESATRSMWDEAIGSQINADVDEDLVSSHQAGVLALVEWSTAAHLSLASHVFLPENPTPARIIDPQSLLCGVSQSPGLLVRGTAQSRVEMLMPLVAQLQSVSLDSRSCPAPATVKRARL